MFSGKVDINRLCEVGDLRCDHVSWQVRQELLPTVLALESSRILGHFAAAVFRHAGRVEDPIVVLDARDIPVEKEEVILVSVVFVCQALADLAN